MRLFIICPTQKMPNVMKISAKIYITQNINISLFVRPLSLTSLKALQLSKVGLLTIKHQHSMVKADMMNRSHLNQNHMKNANCLQGFVHKRCSKCPPFARTHAWRRFLHWSITVSIMSCRKSDHSINKRSFSSLRTVNKQKAKCWYFAWC